MRRAMLVAAAALLVASCGGGTPAATAGTSAPTTTSAGATTTTGAATTTTAASTTTEAAGPLFGSFDQAVTLLTATSGGGIRPLLQWDPVSGADHYGVYVYAPNGDLYWSWLTTDTSVHVGGEPVLHDDAPGPSVAEGMSWAVVAYDAAQLPLAVSAQRPIAP